MFRLQIWTIFTELQMFKTCTIQVVKYKGKYLYISVKCTVLLKSIKIYIYHKLIIKNMNYVKLSLHRPR